MTRHQMGVDAAMKDYLVLSSWMRRAPPWSRGTAAGAAGQAFDDGDDEPAAHGGDRVWHVAFGTQGWMRRVGDGREWQVACVARRNEVLRGNVSRSEMRKP